VPTWRADFDEAVVGGVAQMTPPAGLAVASRGFLLPEAPVRSLLEYLAIGGGTGLARARQLGPGGTVAEVLASGLQGRGGAGFPTGRKWGAVAAAPGAHYLVCNGTEGEPGTFKDRALLRANPYQALEGAAIAAYAVGARSVYVAVKARFGPEIDALSRAMVEMSEAALLGDVPFNLVTGPDEYLFGEEKALLEVVEGEAPLPRNLPPYLHGLYAAAPQLGWSAKAGTEESPRAESNPTVVNNVETLSTVAHILARGAAWFRQFGTAGSPGTVVTTVVGDVVRPGVFEVELGTPLYELIDLAGGLPAGRSVKAVLSGAANGVLTGDQLDLPLDRDALAGGGLGAAGFIVYDDTACMVEVARIFSRFLWIESCGQCLCCKTAATCPSRSSWSSAPSWPASPRSSPPTWPARALGPARSLSPSWSTCPTAWPATTTATDSSSPIGPTTNRPPSARTGDGKGRVAGNTNLESETSRRARTTRWTAATRGDCPPPSFGPACSCSSRNSRATATTLFPVSSRSASTTSRRPCTGCFALWRRRECCVPNGSSPAPARPGASTTSPPGATKRSPDGRPRSRTPPVPSTTTWTAMPRPATGAGRASLEPELSDPRIRNPRGPALVEHSWIAPYSAPYGVFDPDFAHCSHRHGALVGCQTPVWASRLEARRLVGEGGLLLGRPGEGARRAASPLVPSPLQSSRSLRRSPTRP